MIKIRKDLKNRKFDKLTVLRRAEDIVYSNGEKRSAWLCRCECGKEKVIVGASLLSGGSKNCGCVRNEKTIRRNKKNNKNLVGHRFGMLVVEDSAEDIISADNKHRTAWKCRCDCGNETIVTENDLKTKNTKSCGCYKGIKIRERSFENLKGQEFGRLKVLSRASDYIDSRGKHNTRWHCRCQCGNECDVLSSSLKSENTLSCGCYRYDRVGEVLSIDLIGQRFGKLTVLGKGKGRRYQGIKRVTWVCRCDCGTRLEVVTNALTSGNTMSCGCMKSGLELNVLRYLHENSYIQDEDYKYQVRYTDLRGENGRELSYDFGVLKDGIIVLLIECQGIQHYRPVDLFGGEDQFELQKKHDKKKKEYADKIGVPMIEIPYSIDTYPKMKKYLSGIGL